MAYVVFLRGVNVGGHKAFRPSVLASTLSRLNVKSFGAAGTFIVRGTVSERAARAEFLRYLPFDAQVMMCKAQELVDLVGDDPLRDQAHDKDITRFVSVLEKRPRAMPPLPIYAPESPGNNDWQVAVMAVRGCFAVSLRRPRGKTVIYPNEVVEKRLGVAATTRNWNTILTLCADLETASQPAVKVRTGCEVQRSLPRSHRDTEKS